MGLGPLDLEAALGRGRGTVLRADWEGARTEFELVFAPDADDEPGAGAEPWEVTP